MIDYVDIMEDKFDFDGMSGWFVFMLPDGRYMDISFDYCAAIDSVSLQFPGAYAAFEPFIRDYMGSMRRDARRLHEDWLVAVALESNDSAGGWVN